MEVNWPYFCIWVLKIILMNKITKFSFGAFGLVLCQRIEMLKKNNGDGISVYGTIYYYYHYYYCVVYAVWQVPRRETITTQIKAFIMSSN